MEARQSGVSNTVSSRRKFSSRYLPLVVMFIVAAGAGGWMETTRGTPSATGYAPLGGFRALAADLVWLQAYRAWEARDEAALGRHLQRVGEIDPRPLAFWLNGARMLAYDVTAWRLAADTGWQALPLENENSQMIRDQQMAAALSQLDRARAHHATAAIEIEEALIRMQVSRDLPEAIAAMRRAEAAPDAPDYVASVRRELEARWRDLRP